METLASRNVSVDEQSLIALGRTVLKVEAAAIASLALQINHHFAKACQYLLRCEGRVVVTGMGKSGHIAKKIAATFASTGTPAFFLHPAEASHGDMGMITRKDVVVALSNSGETQEILVLLPLMKRLHIPIISLTGNPHSTLAKFADVHLDTSVEKEACPLGLAPSASTTASLAMGDALALALLETRGFTSEDFAQSHPGGKLGKQLLLKIEDVMRTGDAIPHVPENTPLAQAVIEMTKKRLGFTTIVSNQNPKKLVGVFTDGDLRRAFERGLDFHKTLVSEVMSKSCHAIKAGTLAAQAIHMMESIKSFVLPVVDAHDELIGALNMHDLLQAGVL